VTLVLASTSPQRRLILEQLRIPFEVVAPDFDEVPGTTPLDRASGKARSVTLLDERPVLGVDTEVLVDGALLGKPGSVEEAGEMLGLLAGRTHDVVSGLCLRTRDWEDVREETTHVTFRPVTGPERNRYVATGEWAGRAGGYAVQGLGASLVERIDGDYLNVVGLPAAALVGLLVARFPGRYF
jgi:septum formation protein